MAIEHIVISGGGPSGFMALGVIIEASDMGLLDISKIKTISGTSIGAILGCMLCIGHSMEVLHDYVVKRPWEKALHAYTSDLIDIFEKGGLDGPSIVKIILTPLLEVADLSSEATLKEVYDKSNIELKVVTIDVNANYGLEPTVVSWRSHPDLPLFKAAAMSCAVPFVFRPVIEGNGCYIDGGVTSNYPVGLCCPDIEDRDSILGIRNKYSSKNELITSNNNSGLAFLKLLFSKMHNTLDSSSEEHHVPYEIICDVTDMTGLTRWIEAGSSETIRQEAVNRGKQTMRDYLKGAVKKLLESV
jgi:predicted acylesterase/phospholipase RssA